MPIYDEKLPKFMLTQSERLVIFREEDVGGRERVTTDEERVAPGAEQRSGCADKKVEQWQEFVAVIGEGATTE